MSYKNDKNISKLNIGESESSTLNWNYVCNVESDPHRRVVLRVQMRASAGAYTESEMTFVAHAAISDSFVDVKCGQLEFQVHPESCDTTLTCNALTMPTSAHRLPYVY
ncbi:hypothetical protein EVAR_97321_1 [Eumeta japonica]|uniref:Uncharacterized protein n=1 Tax=Eumeta variegata TaxID=151549 RepID=A0A4C1X5C9_EUMVA|nr:hypothetical protein EVAR_97321_1 [Eumeta japonica]